MKRLLALILLLPSLVMAQGARITQDPWVASRSGTPVGGASVAICQPLSTTAASLVSNIATFTMSSNPITAGFVNGMTVQITGFIGGDTYFNQGTLTDGSLANGVPIILVTSTQIIVGPISHANGSASTNGTVLQIGNSNTPCAGLATIYTDASLVTTTANPLTTDGLGNYDAGAVPGVYYSQVYGSGITTTLRQIVVPCTNAMSASCGSGGGGGSGSIVMCLTTGGVLFQNGTNNTATCGSNVEWLPGPGLTGGGLEFENAVTLTTDGTVIGGGGLADVTINSPNTDASDSFGITGEVDAHGSGTFNGTMRGLTGIATYDGTGIINELAASSDTRNQNLGGGTITRNVGHDCGDQHGISGTLNVCYYAPDQGTGANDYAYVSAGGKSSFPIIDNILYVDGIKYNGSTDLGATLNTMESVLTTTISGFKAGKIVIPSGSYVMTTTATLSPFVSIECSSGASIDYQGTTEGFLFTTETGAFNYQGSGGIDGCIITNTTNNATAIVELQNTTDVHIRNTFIQGGGTGTVTCLLYNSDGANHYNEQSSLDRVYMSNCGAGVKFTVTNSGTGSFAYTRWRAVTVAPAAGGTAGVLLLNTSILSGSAIEFNAFIPNNTPGVWFRNTSNAIGMQQFAFRCEYQAGATTSNCLKTDTGTTVQTQYVEFTSQTTITDSIATGTLIPYAWNYAFSNLSNGQATPQGILLSPNGTASGYACGASCGNVQIDTNTQTAGTFAHMQAPPNVGTTVTTFCLDKDPCITPAVAGTFASIPATCTVGSLYFATDATAGQNIYECASLNTWTQQLNSSTAATAFSAITSATNTTAAMVIGTGSSLTTSGSGTNTATAMPFSGLSSATNTTGALVLGTGSSLGVSGSGTNYATSLLGNTWASPAAIGTGSAAAGTFTNLIDSALTPGTLPICPNGSGGLFTTSGCVSGGSVFPVTVSGTTTSGGIPYFSNTTTETSSGILNTNILVKGGGAGGAPTNSSITDNGTTVTTTEPIDAGSASFGTGCSAAGSTASGGICDAESANTGWTPTAGQDYMRADSTLHAFICSINGAAEPGCTFGAPATVNSNALATTAADAYQLFNNTASTAGVPVQISPDVRWKGHVWNTTSVADNCAEWISYVAPTSSTAPYSALNFGYSTAASCGGAITLAGSFNTFGQLFMNGSITGLSYSTTTNCAGVGTAANPSVASCSASSVGHFSCATNATGGTCKVNTTAVTANSEIFVFESDTAVTGTALGVTCNTSTNVLPTSRLLASSVAATSFTINLGTVTTNPACFSYQIIN